MGKRVTSIALFDEESIEKLKENVELIDEKLCKVPYRVNNIDNPEQKILAYNQLANSLKNLQSQFQLLNTQQRGMFTDVDVANLNAGISQLSTQFASLGNSASTFQTKLADLKTRLSAIGNISGLDKQKQEFQEIQSEVDELKAKYRELNAENTAANNSIALMSKKTVLGNHIKWV